MSAPTDLLGMDIIPQIFGTRLPLKKNKMLQVNLAEVKIEPILLPEIQPSFTKQYLLKGGHDEVTACINTLIDEGVIERTQSFNFNSPVWPVKKPNGTYRFTVDFRKINELLPAMPGNLPDVQDLFYRIQKGAYTWFASVDLSDMFFALLLHPKSREMTTFSWNNKQCQFKRLPQGYKNNPIIVHVTLQWSLDKLKIPDEYLVLSYVDDVIIAGKSKVRVSKLLEETVEILRKDGWTKNPNKIQNPQNSVKFLGVIWTVKRPKVPDPVLDKIANLKVPTNKTEVQQTIRLFGYWQNHIPYLQILLQSLYQVIKKASDFEWGSQQEHAFKAVKELITQSQLYTIARTDTVILDISYQMGYGNWSVICNEVHAQ
jgi:hypothetical protein